MPNWCSNTLTIKSTEENIKKLKSLIDDYSKSSSEKGLLSAIAPFKEEVGDDWYSKHCDYWGTKWDIPISECYIADELTQELVVSFMSAWSPPIGAYQICLDELRKSDPSASVRGTFDEGGVGFIGIWEDGEDNTMELSSLYQGLIDKDPASEKFAEDYGTSLEHLAESFFCTQDDGCECYNCKDDDKE